MLARLKPAGSSVGERIRFGKYLLLERISVGGMAEVWRARELEGAGRVVAIKRLLPNVAEHPELVSMFIAEATLLLQLDHPHIVRVYEVGESAHQRFISMDYIRGKDLRQVLSRCRQLGQRLPLPVTWHLASKLCEALDYAHRWREPSGREANLVHRDVSPSNLLLGFGGEVKLIDFGIAQAGERPSPGDPMNGKRAYMSPEQAHGLATDRRSDIFSVGVCLYEMLTGERPGRGESIQGVAPPLEQMVFKALATDPETRYQCASELAADLQRFLRQFHFEAKDLATYMQSSYGEEIETETQAPRLAESPSAAPLPRAVALGPLLSNALALPRSTVPSPTETVEPQHKAAPPATEEDPDTVPQGIWSPPLRVSDAVRASVRAFAEPTGVPKPAKSAGQSETAAPEPLGPRLLRSDAGESQVSAAGTSPSAAIDADEANELPTGSTARTSAVGKGKAMAFGMAGAAVVSAVAAASFWLAQEANSGFLSIVVPAELKEKHLVVAFRGEPLRVPEQGKLLHKAKAGPGVLTLEADGYQPSSQSLRIHRMHQITEITASLAPVVRTALLAVVTEPEDAEVRIDGALAAPSGAAPFYLVEISVGAERLVQVHRAGFKSFESRVRASTSGEQMRIRAKLQPLDYSLSISSSPSGALIWANGGRLGRSPMEIHLPSTTTELVVGKRCYQPVQVPLSNPTEASEPVPLHVSLKRLSSCR